jgi:tungstate transport system ATP-binding protein
MVGPILPLRLTDAVVRKHGKTIVGPVSTEIGPEGFTVVMGPNGAGKTTFLRLMHGLETPREGSVEWQGPPTVVRTRQVLVFQTPIVMRRSVLANISYPLVVRGSARSAALEKATLWGEKIGLKAVLNAHAQVLSGGEKQKLAIARALITEPEVLFLDEPTTNLDGSSTREIEAILRDAFDGGTRIIMATHDIGQAKRLATDIMFLYRSRLHEVSPVDTFFDAPKTDEARAFLNGDIVE